MGLKLHLSKYGIGSHLNGDDQLTIVIGGDRPVCAIKDHGQVDPSTFFVVSAMHFKILQSPQNFILEPRHLQVLMMDPQLTCRQKKHPKSCFQPGKENDLNQTSMILFQPFTFKKGYTVTYQPWMFFKKKNQTRICVQGAPIWAGHF